MANFDNSRNSKTSATADRKFAPLGWQRTKEGQQRVEETQWLNGCSVGYAQGVQDTRTEFASTRARLIEAGVELAKANAQLTQALTYLLNKHS